MFFNYKVWVAGHESNKDFRVVYIWYRSLKSLGTITRPKIFFFYLYIIFIGHNSGDRIPYVADVACRSNITDVEVIGRYSCMGGNESLGGPKA